MNFKQVTGKEGEDLACDYIRSKKYKILERNHRQKYGEIDIIAKKKDGLLVFFEVKAMRFGSSEMSPEMNLSPLKLKKLQRTAYIYANNNLKLVDNEKGWQIDLIAIDLTDNEKDCDIRHYENI
ncbi:MAG: YraN family protein [Patescibacteria group bacterium]